MRLVGILSLSMLACSLLQAGQSDTLKRDHQSTFTLETSLSQKIYKTVQVQVPYEEQEGYTVSVPFTDYEYYDEQEYICHTRTDYEHVCQNENVCRNESVPEQICNNENVCNYVPDVRRECHNEVRCETNSQPGNCRTVEECGTGSNGQRVCRQRQVCDRPTQQCHPEEVCNSVDRGRNECHNESRCHTEYRDRQVCHTEQQCQNVPRERQECAYETVRKSREVTRYRDETRYRNVTKCCKTEDQQVFDHDFTLPVEVQLPSEAILMVGESEEFTVQLRGSEAEPSVSFEVTESVFGYFVKSSVLKENKYVIELALRPKFTAKDLGKEQVSLFSTELRPSPTELLLKVTDNGFKPRVKTYYHVEVIHSVSQAVLGTLDFELHASHMEPILTLNAPLDISGAIEIKAEVSRKGIVLEQDINFTLIKNISFGLNDEKLVTDPALQKEGKDYLVTFKDDSQFGSDKIRTEYRIVMKRSKGPSQGKVFVDALIDRSQLATSPSTDINVSLTKDLKMSQSVVDRWLYSKAPVSIELTVKRIYVLTGESTEFVKTSSLTLP